MKRKIIITGAVLLLLAIILFKIATIDEKTGGWNEPRDFKSSSDLLKTQVPSFADSICHNWWTGGTQEWKYWTKFKIPNEKIHDFINDKIKLKEKEIGIGINRTNFNQSFIHIKHKPSWFVSNSKSEGICIRSYFLGIENSIIWIDTISNYVYQFNN
jgi:hypothetical protein